MSSILLVYGKGKGDHIRFSAIVREYAKTHERVGIFSTRPYFDSVSFLLRDVPNVKIHFADTPGERCQLIGWRRFLASGSDRYDRIANLEPDEEFGVQVERLIYAMAGVHFEKKWSAFHLERDQEKEQACFTANVPSEPYVFLHEDSRYALNRSPIAPGLPIVLSDPARDVFDHCLVLERAREIHVFNSAFVFLADQLAYENPEQKLFFHMYARPMRPFFDLILRKPWIMLNQPRIEVRDEYFL